MVAPGLPFGPQPSPIAPGRSTTPAPVQGDRQDLVGDRHLADLQTSNWGNWIDQTCGAIGRSNRCQANRAAPAMPARLPSSATNNCNPSREVGNTRRSISA